jgi:hypothetical protein
MSAHSVKFCADFSVRHASQTLTVISLGMTVVGVGCPFYFANIYDQEGVSKFTDIFNTEIDSTICWAQMVLLSTMHVLSEFGGNSTCLRQKLVQRRFSCRQLHWLAKHVSFEQRQPNPSIARTASSN